LRKASKLDLPPSADEATKMSSVRDACAFMLRYSDARAVHLLRKKTGRRELFLDELAGAQGGLLRVPPLPNIHPVFSAGFC
jgi:hypothetical protein